MKTIITIMAYPFAVLSWVLNRIGNFIVAIFTEADNVLARWEK